MNEKDSKDAILFELDQAWDHLRHHENMRFKCFALLFSISLVTVGILGALAKNLKTEPLIAVATAILLCTLVTVITFVIGRMLDSVTLFVRWHGKVINELRQQIHSQETVELLNPQLSSINVEGRLRFGSAVLIIAKVISYLFGVLTVALISYLAFLKL